VSIVSLQVGKFIAHLPDHGLTGGLGAGGMCYVFYRISDFLRPGDFDLPDCDTQLFQFLQGGLRVARCPGDNQVRFELNNTLKVNPERIPNAWNLSYRFGKIAVFNDGFKRRGWAPG
jgi:hypothetical protein